ncbi:MAG TPA: hypothetical protein VIL13_12480 [Longimicrobiales bacterium]
MSGPVVPRKINKALRRKLEAAAALASERLIERHAGYALELIEAARGKVSPQRALDIYIRLHHLRDREADRLTTRVLASFGQKLEARWRRGAPGSEAGGQDAWDVPESWAKRIRNRLRGRVFHDLRRWVEIHTGKVEVALLDVHVENALRFYEILGNQTPIAAVVGLYVEAVGVRRSLAETIYLLLLDRLSRLEEAAAAEQRTPNEEPAPVPVPAKHPLRVITPAS